MTHLEIIASLLQDAGLGTQGQSIFIHRMPTEAVGFLIREGYSGDKIDHELPGYRKGDFLLTYRSNDFSDGRDKIKQAMDALTMLNEPFEGIEYRYCRPRTEPMTYPLSVGNMVEQAVQFDVCYIALD